MAPDRDLIVARLRAAGCVNAEDEAELLIEAGDPALVDRRVAGEPLEHVLGWAAFAGRRWTVAPGVFVPRHRTEFLVSLAAAHGGSVLLDLCCGCGALAGSVAPLLRRSGRDPGAIHDHCGGEVEVHAVDIDPAAVACARGNLPGAAVYCGDLFGPLPSGLRGRVDVLLANVPYVPTDAIALLPPEARDFEARAALDGGRDGLDVLRRALDAALAWLAPGGALFSEIGAAQEQPAFDAALAAGVIGRIERDDDTSVLVVAAPRSIRRG